MDVRQTPSSQGFKVEELGQNRRRRRKLKPSRRPAPLGREREKWTDWFARKVCHKANSRRGKT